MLRAFPRGDRGVVEVRLVEIDVVAAEPAERIFGGSDDMVFRKPFADIFMSPPTFVAIRT